MTPENEDSTFLALSNILKAVEGAGNFGALDSESQSILKLIAVHEDRGDEICITEIANHPSLSGSPVTLLKRVHGLHRTGWIEFENSTLHHRRIRLRLSEQTKAEFRRMSTDLGALVSIGRV